MFHIYIYLHCPLYNPLVSQNVEEVVHLNIIIVLHSQIICVLCSARLSWSWGCVWTNSGADDISYTFCVRIATRCTVHVYTIIFSIVCPCVTGLPYFAITV